MLSSIRLAPVFAGTFLCALATAQSAPMPGGDLREEIRRIVREEVRAALREAHSDMAIATTPATPTAPKVAKVMRLGKPAEAKKAAVEVREVEGEMLKLDNLVKQLEVVVEGEAKAGAAPKAKREGHQIQFDGGTLLIEGMGEAAEPVHMQKLLEAGKAHGMVLQHGNKAEQPIALRVICNDGKFKVEQVGGGECKGQCEGVMVLGGGGKEGQCELKIVGSGECCDEAKEAKGECCEEAGKSECCEDGAKQKGKDKAKKAKKSKGKKAKAKAADNCAIECEVELKSDCDGGSCEAGAKAKSECCEVDTKAKSECCEEGAKAKSEGCCGSCIEAKPVEVKLENLRLAPMKIELQEAAPVRVRSFKAASAKDPRVL